MSQSNKVFSEYATRYGKILAALVLLLKYLRRKINNIYITYLQKYGKVDERMILFSSTPDYSDNSKALSDYLIINDFCQKFKIYWLIDDVDKSSAVNGNRGIEFIPRNISSLLSEMPFHTIKVCMTAKYVFSTHANRIPKSKGLRNQKYIYLWHGCGYKENNKETRNGNLFDVCLVPGPLFVKTKAHFWNIDESKFLPIGYPRYDWLKNPSPKALDLYLEEKGSCEKLVLWMPTIRNPKHGQFKENSIRDSPILRNMEEWKSIDEVCRQNKVKIAVKLHPLQKMYDIDFGRLKNIIQISQDFFSSKGVNMYEFIGLTDGLISDYSSVAIDYLLVDKPIAFTLDDFESYKNNRGFVFENPLDYMPGHHLYTLSDLKKYIKEISDGIDTHAKERHKMLPIAIHKSENYCKEITERIIVD